jgi:hypothetical protein
MKNPLGITLIQPEAGGKGEASGTNTDSLNSKDLSDKYGVRICLRISPELYQELEGEAGIKGYTSLSGYIRRILEAR